jgi:hypothetical protein
VERKSGCGAARPPTFFRRLRRQSTDDSSPSDTLPSPLPNFVCFYLHQANLQTQLAAAASDLVCILSSLLLLPLSNSRHCERLIFPLPVRERKLAPLSFWIYGAAMSLLILAIRSLLFYLLM